MDAPVPLEAGVSAARERRWGFVGAVVGSATGIGAAAVAVGIDGASFYETGLFPRIFQSGDILAIDLYLLVMLVAGASFSAAALVLARKSPYPRTETYGAGLVGLILMSLAGFIFFTRLMALVNSR
ncbi:MAG: hypothetical protein ACRD21_13220 [Vicinamibacteria bacterium]